MAVAAASRPAEKGAKDCGFSPSRKPTRLLLCTSLDMPDFVYEGLPSYDDQGYYKGPLPSAQGFGQMFQRQAKGAFKTTGPEQWPVAMCQWLSAMLLSSCLLPAKDAVGEGGAAAPDDKLQASSHSFHSCLSCVCSSRSLARAQPCSPPAAILKASFSSCSSDPTLAMMSFSILSLSQFQEEPSA